MKFGINSTKTTRALQTESLLLRLCRGTHEKVRTEARSKIPRQPRGAHEKGSKPYNIAFGLSTRGENLGSSLEATPFFFARDNPWAIGVL